jgi:FHS family glucose/mannose:H+ symporter-like MFS transporter
VRAIHVGFVLCGVVTTLLGPILPSLSVRWSINDSQAGYLFTAQFMGGLCGMLISNRVGLRLGVLRALMVGYGMMSFGVGVLAISIWPAGIIPVFCFGMGIGVTVPLSNLLISDLNQQRSAAALNMLNFSWCIGAVVGPPLIAAQMRHGNQSWGLFILATVLVLIVLLVNSRKIDIDPVAPPKTVSSSLGAAQTFNLLLIAICILAFLYVGTETSVGGWSASYALRSENTSSRFWLASQSMFWAALLLGRGLAPVALRYLNDAKLVLSGLVIAESGLVLLIFSIGPMALAAGLILAGLGLGPIYPTTTAILFRYFRLGSPRIIGAFFALSSFGGAVLPWIVGYISNNSGSLKTGLSFLVFGILLMMVLQSIVLSRSKQPDPQMRIHL